jgi:hypothetical protein
MQSGTAWTTWESVSRNIASCLLQVVTAWNGLAISAYANASRVLASEHAQAEPRFPVEGRPASDYLQAAQKVLLIVHDGRLRQFTGELQ